ncbi:Spindle assembly checkpoint component MAD1 [Golovinomyces cichoracearum]|uniref:Spindle assembly checkpoint component MAD1 n=1 Tax=Golovinomyces cichoracearum TaxID=62708 RepID=A0A420JAL5_9PEZI|nr:Spindle assembly checkpoint component MAD1 [Golovinomyces cichoracearum]
MAAFTPLQADASQRRNTVSASGIRQPNFGNSIPRARTTIANLKAANSQPSFNFLTGESPRATHGGDDFRKTISNIPLSTSRRNTLALDNENEKERHKKEFDNLTAENKTLKYTIDSYKQEQELSKLRYEGELRDVTRRAEDDFKKAQTADADRTKAVRQLQSALNEIKEIRDSADQDKASFSKKLREQAETQRELEEKLLDLKTEHEEAIRNLGRNLTELESRNQSLRQTIQDLQDESKNKEKDLQDIQQKLSEKISDCGQYEAEILRLKAQISDDETLSIIKRELTEQVSHIKRQELKNRELMSELNHFKQIHKSVEVVEEEKMTLQRRLDAKEGLELELEEAKTQRQRLEDERSAWTAYLQSQAGPNGEVEFDSPEAIARALNSERLNTATLLERIGSLNQDLSNKECIIQNIEKDKQNLKEELEKLKTSGAEKNLGKLQLRLERQKNLAIKEAEYLRAQLKTYDTEDLTFQPETVDESKSKLISELEDLVEQYRQELQVLNDELASKENSKPETLGSKRKCDDSGDYDRQDQLIRKLRNLQNELDSLHNSKMLLEKDLSVARERLEAALQQNKTRILALRNNPTSNYEAIKQTTLTTLRQENYELLAQLQGTAQSVESVPSSSLAAARLEHSATQQALASEKKRNDRLMKVWGAKSTEFRQMVISLLGWDVVFMRDGKTRMTSFFYPSHDDDENSIVFDGEKGTMKVSGGPKSAFAIKISDQIRFWCKERGSIPCFLAALTLEFWEEKNGDRTLQGVDQL